MPAIWEPPEPLPVSSPPPPRPPFLVCAMAATVGELAYVGEEPQRRQEQSRLKRCSQKLDCTPTHAGTLTDGVPRPARQSLLCVQGALPRDAEAKDISITFYQSNYLIERVTTPLLFRVS